MRQTCPTGPHQGLKPGKNPEIVFHYHFPNSLFWARNSKSAQLTNFNKNLGHSKLFFHAFHVSKTQKHLLFYHSDKKSVDFKMSFLMPSILPKSERKQFDLRYHSIKVVFWENWRYQKYISTLTDLYDIWFSNNNVCPT